MFEAIVKQARSHPQTTKSCKNNEMLCFFNVDTSDLNMNFA